MHDFEREALAKHIETCLGILKLSDWQITISNAPCAKGFKAEIKADEEYRIATIYLAPNFFERPATERDEVIAHEICHLFLARCAACLDDLESHLSAPVYELLCAQFKKSEEYAVEMVSRAILPTLPSFQLDPSPKSTPRKPNRTRHKAKA